MKKLFSVLLLILALLSYSQEKYQVTIDLTQATDDKLPVTLMVPSVIEKEIEYHMPKVVPGTYSISDFGRFVVDFQALDSAGNALNFEKISTNRWLIKDADKLAKITYWVEDSFDNFDGYGRNKLFEPGGMGIDVSKNIYVMNTFGYIGYLEGYKFKPFELTIAHDEQIKGATSLKKATETPTSDTYIAENYNFLADAPLMYSEPDMVTKTIAGAEVLVSVYSPNKVLSAQDVMDNIDELMEAQAEYLGGELPVDRYAYLIYLFDNNTISGSYGALEHSYSSLYTLPEMDPARISQTVKDVAAHEFFHIVTPLNIHAEQIHDFNYIEPEMSQHLWLYEGVTEYSSHHVQVKCGLYGIDDFLTQIRNKMIEQQEYNVDIPYTVFSENILEPENERRYGDVYSGGALIAMCLDLTIIKSTSGKKDLQQVLRELSREYGPMKAFKDEELFDKIESLTTPEVGAFLRNHVADIEPLPFAEVLGWAGISYTADSDKMVVTAGKFTPAVNDDREIYVASTEDMNAFGKDLGLKEDDVLLEWNEKPLTLETFASTVQEFYDTTAEGDKVTVTVKREVKGKQKEKKLKAKAMLVQSSQKHALQILENPSEEQLTLRNQWLSK